MTTKEKILHAVNELPPDATFADAVERLVYLSKVEKGLRQAAAGETISHDEMKGKMEKWLK